MGNQLEIFGSKIEFGNIELGSFSTFLKDQFASSKKVIIVDDNTHDNCLEYLLTTFPELESAEVMLLPNGEENKVMEVCFQVWEALSEYQINRGDLIINLGGGVITDMGGFIASVFKRGVHFINIPTTLLGMVDAALGGKTGIDLGMYKNQLGTFTLPVATYVDSRFLHTLPEGEWINGIAEMLKHGLIADSQLWIDICEIIQNSDADFNAWEELVPRAAAIKIEVVADDPTEKGRRKLLNFGHTIGHALEGSFLFEENPIPHGVGVAYGMLGEAYLSFKRGFLTEKELTEIKQVLVSFFPNPGNLTGYMDTVLKLIVNDKKNDSSGVKCVLLTGIGTAIYDELISNEEIIEAVNFVGTSYGN